MSLTSACKQTMQTGKGKCPLRNTSSPPPTPTPSVTVSITITSCVLASELQALHVLSHVLPVAALGLVSPPLKTQGNGTDA